MKNKSIAELKKLFANGEINDTSIENLKLDDRKGVQALIASYERQRLKEAALEKNFVAMCQFENQCYNRGFQYIAGLDEAGRGPLAGPVVAAAVILPSDFKLIGLNDSKQLNETTRNNFFAIIKEQAVSYGIAVIDSKKIDQINIYEATRLAMHDALEQLDPTPDYALIDAVNLKGLPYPSESITKGDQKSITIAAASILAKVTRDNIMKEIHNKYPVYDFESNMGYGTKHHIEKLMEYGATPYHRRSFAPVSSIKY